MRVTLPTIPFDDFSAPNLPPLRSNIASTRAELWVEGLRQANTPSEREQRLAPNSDDAVVAAVSRAVLCDSDLQKSEFPVYGSWRKTVAAHWLVHAFESTPARGPNLPTLNYHGNIALPDGFEGLVSIPMLRALQLFDTPIEFVPFAPLAGAPFMRILRTEGLNRFGGRRGFHVLVGVARSAARKPHNFEFFPELGAVVRA